VDDDLAQIGGCPSLERGQVSLPLERVAVGERAVSLCFWREQSFLPLERAGVGAFEGRRCPSLKDESMYQ